MWNAGLDEAQTGINIARRNINNLRYTDDTTLIAKNEDHGIWPHHFMQIDGETMETVTDFTFLDSKIISDGDCSHEIHVVEMFNIVIQNSAPKYQ